jgi:hypothetical protein
MYEQRKSCKSWVGKMPHELCQGRHALHYYRACNALLQSMHMQCGQCRENCYDSEQ